ncbi:MAG: protein kinase, partial [Planctomycetota bacterium]|nr:protein kinase [Planctomycetota bacterium]
MTPNERLAKMLLQLGYCERSIIEQSLKRCQVGSGWDLGDFLLRTKVISAEQLNYARALSNDDSNSNATLISARSASVMGSSPNQSGNRDFGPESLHGTGPDQYLTRIEELGVGGMGAVFRVEDKRLGRHAAMKVLLKETIDPDLRQRFLREAQITARLVHPSIPSVYEVGTTPDGELYFLMQVVEGRTLEDHIEDFHARGAPPEALNGLLEVLVKASEAIAYAHSQGYIHRDLKPSNIMIGQFGEVMVMDWGIAKELGKEEDPFVLSLGLSPEKLEKEAGLTVEGTVLGTPGFMPPEQAGGDKVSEESDVFALGALLTCILTGEPPITGGNMFNVLAATVKEEIFTPRMRNRRISRELDGLARAALKGNPEERLSSAEMFFRDLRAYLNQRFLATVHYSFFEKARRRLAQHSSLIIGGLIFLTVILLLVVLTQRLSLQQKFQAELITSNTDLKKEKGSLVKENIEKNKELEGLRRSRILMLRAESTGNSAKELDTARRYVDEALSLNRTEELKLRACRLFINFRDWKKAKALAKELALSKRLVYEALFLENLILELEADRDEELFEPMRRLAIFYDNGVENDYTVFAAGFRHYLDKEFRKALALFRKLTARKERSYFLTYRASCHFFLKDYEKSILWANKAVAANPKNAYAHVNLARSYSETKERQKSLIHIVAACSLKPNVRLFLSYRAQILSELDDFPSAIRDINSLLNRPGDHGRLYARRAELYRLSKNLKKAEQDARRALTTPTLGFFAFRVHALTLMDQKRWDDAITSIDQGLARFPKRGLLHSLKAECYRRLKRYDLALNEFDQAIFLGESGLPTLNNRAIVMARLKKHKLAIAEFSMVLSRAEFPTTYGERALSYEAIGNYENALKDLNTGIKLTPDRADFYVYKARVLRKMGRLEDALKICNDSLAMADRLRTLLFTRAQIHMGQNNLELARRD